MVRGAVPCEAEDRGYGQEGANALCAQCLDHALVQDGPELVQFLPFRLLVKQIR